MAAIISFSTFGTVCLAIFTIALARQLYRYVYNVYMHPLAHVPGPKLWAASYIPYAYNLCSGNFTDILCGFHAKYGDTVRFGPDDVSFRDSRAWNDILLAGRGSGKPYLITRDPRIQSTNLRFNEGWDLLNAPDDTHARLRRALNPIFSDQNLRNQEPFMHSQIDVFIKSLRRTVKEKPTDEVDMNSWYSCVAADVIGSLAFGESFACCENGEIHPWLAQVYNSAKAVVIMSAITLFPWLNNLIFYFMGQVIEKITLRHRMMAKEKVDLRLAKNVERKDFINVMQAKHGSDAVLTQDELYSNANLLMLSGVETGASQMVGTLYYLTLHQETTRELSTLLRTKFPSESDITMEAVKDLDLLNAVLNESARLYTVVNVFARMSITEPVVVAGTTVPAWTNVIICPKAVYRDPKFFRDPLKWDPRRWMKDEKYENDKLEVFHPWGLGQRSCIGYRMAQTEMRLVLSRLLWNFDVELSDKSRDWCEQKIFSTPIRREMLVRLKDVRA